MTDALPPALAELAEAKGVTTTWWDWQGERREVPASAVAAVLTALGEDVGSDEAVAASLADVRTRPWRRVLPPTVVHRTGVEGRVLIHAPAGAQVRVSVQLEGGGTLALSPAHHDAAPIHVDGHEVEESAVLLPADLPMGWHTLLADLADISAGPLEPTSTTSVLVVTPARLDPPDGGPDGHRSGLLTQIYQVRSRQSWGIGDLGDLTRLGAWTARAHGSDFVLVNPLHAAEPAPPIEPSPYLPTSRRFVNPIYVDVLAVPDLDRLGPVARAEVDRLAERGRALTAVDLIDRDAVWQVKDAALRVIYRELAGGHADAVARLHALEGDALLDFATWGSLAREHGNRFSTWPEELRDPASPAVAAHRDTHREEISYLAWLQWLVQHQLAGTQWALREAGMSVGLVGDLAVGIHDEGGDRWALGDVFAHGVEVGAPPDQFNQLGQNWSQPPWRPDRLAELGYAPFRDMVRAVLRSAGGLRVDHVIGLFRLWWVPEGHRPDEGAYVRYDHEAMIGVLALEAARAGALVVGEDLGVVEPWVRDYLTERGVLGTSVAWFEWDDAGWRAPERYRELCLATVTTHDLPPSAGYLALEHVAIRERLGLLTRPVEEERSAEAESIAAVRGALVDAGLLEAADAPVAQVLDALHGWLRRTPSVLRGVALTDLVGDVRAVNQPGTDEEYPNWRVPLAGPDRAPLLLEDVVAGAAVT